MGRDEYQITSIVNYFEIGPNSCGDGDIRLVGGKSEREGRVEICYNGVWGTVCDYGWDQVDADVVCRQLGFSYQRALATNNSHFGDGEGPILFENVRCNQFHSNISQCIDFQHIGTFHRCVHTAGVICEGMIMSMSTIQVSIGNQAPAISPHAMRHHNQHIT